MNTLLWEFPRKLRRPLEILCRSVRTERLCLAGLFGFDDCYCFARTGLRMAIDVPLNKCVTDCHDGIGFLINKYNLCVLLRILESKAASINESELIVFELDDTASEDIVRRMATAGFGRNWGKAIIAPELLCQRLLESYFNV